MSKVEVLLATYNGERYLREQIDTILNQTYQDFTILIRDDGSTDGTPEIIREYVQKYPEKITQVEDDKRGGSAVKNFFLLMQHATAEYIMFSDQDDYWLENKIQMTLREAELQESMCGKDCPVLIFADYEAVDQDLKSLSLKESRNQIHAYKLDLNHLLVQNYVTGCLVLANRALYSIAGEYDARMEMHDWWLAICASAFGVIKHIPYKLMLYRQHGDNCVGATDVKSFKYRFSKFMDPQTAAAKDRYYAQAELFAERFGNRANREALNIVNEFTHIQRHKKIGRIARLLKGKYLKGDFVRIIGQIWYI